MSKGLTGKQQAFINAYLGEAAFNATEAARIAGLAHPNKQGPRLLVNVGVREALRERLDEHAMSANEVLKRLSDIASGKVADMVDENGKFSLQVAKERGKDQLLKKLKIKSTSKKVDSFTEGEDEPETFETSLIHEEVEFEMYSAHEALRDLGKYHKLFTDKHEHTGKDGGPIETNAKVVMIPPKLDGDEWQQLANSKK